MNLIQLTSRSTNSGSYSIRENRCHKACAAQTCVAQISTVSSNAALDLFLCIALSLDQVGLSRFRAQATSDIRAWSATGVMAQSVIGIRIHRVAVIRAHSVWAMCIVCDYGRDLSVINIRPQSVPELGLSL